MVRTSAGASGATATTSNAWLLSRARGIETACLCATERQTAGRGRRGREWLSPPGGVTFSLLYHFPLAARDLGGLSLAVGCAIVRVLEALGVQGLGIKWPNDVVHRNRKLCGVLIEIGAGKPDRTPAVVGIGLNYADLNLSPGIDQPAVDLAELLPERPDRNTLIAAVVGELFAVFAEYTEHGFAAILPRWASYDALNGTAVRVLDANGEGVDGIARGVNGRGELVVETDSGTLEFQSGEVSVRRDS